MDRLLYFFARGVILIIQALPLTWVCQLGRGGGALVHLLDRRHRRVVRNNLTLCFGKEKTKREIDALARENFRRIGESFAAAVKTAGMTNAQLTDVLEVKGLEKFRPTQFEGKPPSRVFAVGHFSNFEMFAHCTFHLPEYRFATTYRGVKQKSLNDLLHSLRAGSGALLFERRTDAEALKSAMNSGGLLLGLFSDQHAGDKGLRLKFFGQDCSTSAAPAVLALRYRCPVFTAICYRTGLGRWRVEVGDEVPTHANGEPRTPADIMQDVNDAFETAVRRDPANWFWVHNRWKLSFNAAKADLAR